MQSFALKPADPGEPATIGGDTSARHRLVQIPNPIDLKILTLGASYRSEGFVGKSVFGSTMRYMFAIKIIR